MTPCYPMQCEIYRVNNMPFKDPEKRKEYSKVFNKKYYFKNKEKLAKQRKQYRDNNKEKLKIRVKELRYTNIDRFRERDRLRVNRWRERNKETLKIREKNYYKNNRDKILIQSKEWKQKNKDKIRKNYYQNKDKIREQMKKYRQTHPEIKLRGHIKYLKKYAIHFQLPHYGYQYSLMSWSKTIKKQDDKACQICGSTDKLHAHHILEKKHFPELSLNPNNGITLCVPCHNQTHGKQLLQEIVFKRPVFPLSRFLKY